MGRASLVSGVAVGHHDDFFQTPNTGHSSPQRHRKPLKTGSAEKLSGPLKHPIPANLADSMAEINLKIWLAGPPLRFL
jgi:hypothetical protein